jgi:hypothetical protein
MQAGWAIPIPQLVGGALVRIVQRGEGAESPFQADLNASAIALVRLTVQMSISSGIVHFPSPLSW